ncbi:glycosyltransferase family 2 protein [Algoriphagus aquatilis]|uniref:Glycosyltransferase family 2 protein n=1 Tax=Algoriphagus aquatilis TaxID=490186 RepID=A0ABW0BVB6_9BACT
MSKVSIIIPIFNASPLLERCINSVLANNGDFPLEIICIDDGSTDNSVEILREKYPMVPILKQSNQGPASARNKGIANATGKYLAFLDADDYWLAGFIEKTVSFLERHPDAVAVSVGQEHHLPNGSTNLAPQILSFNDNLQSMVLEDFFEFWSAQNHVCTGSVLMRTDVVKQTGGQRPGLRITEDLEFWAYMATFGKWGFIPEVLFVSDGGEVTKSLGWWEKNLIRWKSAPSIQEWEKRIIQRQPELQHDKGYQLATGRICKNLAYSALLSGRIELSRNMVFERGAYFPDDKVAKILKRTAPNPFVFFLAVNFLKIRERFRKI